MKFDGEDLAIMLGQGGGHGGGLAEARGGAGAQDDGAFGQAKRGILDEDAIGEGVEGGKFGHLGPGGPECGDVRRMVGLKAREIRRTGVDVAEALGDGGPGRAGDGMGEAVGTSGHG
jgi:hypothetical protein